MSPFCGLSPSFQLGHSFEIKTPIRKYSHKDFHVYIAMNLQRPYFQATEE
ncbi:hypothetical protein JMJ77_0001848, partial [Colletotrichum scovillei]